MELNETCNIKSICGACLRIDNNLNPIFQKNLIDDISILDLLSECSIYPEDGDPPSFLCSECLDTLKSVHVFKKQCENSYIQLKLIVDECNAEISKDTTELDVYFYECEICKDQFTEFNKLKDHHKVKHRKSDIKCPSCSKIYIKVGDETKTQLLENQLPSIKDCSQCNPSAVDQPDDSLSKNADGENIPWQYMCSSCAQTFSSEVLFKKHSCDISYDISSKKDVSSTLETSQIKIDGPENSDDHTLETISGTESVEEGGGDDRIDNDSEDEGMDWKADESSANSDSKTKSKKAQEEAKPKRKYRRRNLNDNGEHNKCHICNKVFSRHTHLRRHFLTHSEDKPFSCEVCSKGFTRLDHLNIHRHHHSEVKPFNCDVCQRGFIRAEHLKNHKEALHGNRANPLKKEVCEICKKAFTTTKYLQIHMRIHGERTFPCKTCLEKFKTKPELTQHMKTHANEKPYLCSECGLRFVRNDYLVIHMRRHKGEKPYKCKYCGKGFPRATDLTVHERYHTGEKTHLCTICGKGFQRAYNLLVHMRVHTGERPYKCPHCSKSFAQGNDLKAHIRRHTGERFKCELCGDGFIQGYHLTQHKRVVHGIDMKSHIRRVQKFTTIVDQDQKPQDIQVTVQENTSKDTETGDEDGPKAEVVDFSQNVIKLEADNMEIQTVKITPEVAGVLDSGQSFTLVSFTDLEEKIKFESAYD